MEACRTLQMKNLRLVKNKQPKQKIRNFSGGDRQAQRRSMFWTNLIIAQHFIFPELSLVARASPEQKGKKSPSWKLVYTLYYKWRFSSSRQWENLFWTSFLGESSAEPFGLKCRWLQRSNEFPVLLWKKPVRFVGVATCLSDGVQVVLLLETNPRLQEICRAHMKPRLLIGNIFNNGTTCPPTTYCISCGHPPDLP